MGIAKEFYLDLSNSDNNILDLSEYKGKRIKVSVEEDKDINGSIEDEFEKLIRFGKIMRTNPQLFSEYKFNRDELYDR